MIIRNKDGLKRFFVTKTPLTNTLRLVTKILLVSLLLPLVPGVVLSVVAHRELFALATEALLEKDALLAVHIKALGQKQLLIIAATCLGFAALGLAAARSFTTPLSRLTAATRKVAAGDLTARSQISRKDELGDLARSFDAMVPKLKRHMELMQAMEMAHQAQSRLYPRGVVTAGRLKAAGDIDVCDLVGGDLFHIARLKDGLALTVADVSGHGPGVGLLMALVKAYLTAVAASSPKKTLEKLNHWLGDDLKQGSFVTMCSAHIRGDGTITAASAGHPPMFRWRNRRLTPLGGGDYGAKPPNGVVLGAVADFQYSQFSPPKLKKGDILLLISDGIFELKDKNGKPFINGEIPRLLARHGNKAPDKTCAAILKAARNKGKTIAEDDITVLLATL